MIPCVFGLNGSVLVAHISYLTVSADLTAGFFGSVISYNKYSNFYVLILIYLDSLSKSKAITLQVREHFWSISDIFLILLFYIDSKSRWKWGNKYDAAHRLAYLLNFTIFNTY